MSAIWLTITGFLAFFAGYWLYSRFICKAIYKLDRNRKTPAHEMKDGIDYVPTNRYVLWGHHFTSVAGVAPIIGPAIAVIWGWLPAFLWIIFGTVFFAGAHDMGAIWVSIRNRAATIGSCAGIFLGRTGQLLFLIIVFLLLLMANSIFAVVISNSFVNTPSSVVPSWGAIFVAVIIGQLIYKAKAKLLPVTIAGVVVLYLLIFAGTELPFHLPEKFLGLAPGAMWIIILFIYAGIASSLPVWTLLQPRDYINGIQLFIGLAILYLAIFFGNPSIVAPALNNVPAGTPSMVPLLFVTVACGAISGFHGIVGSGTTSKQINRETDIKLVGYGGALGEGLLALSALIAVSAGFANAAAWNETYSAFGNGGLAGYIDGAANIITQGLGISHAFSVNLLAVMAILFAGTTMDTGVRLQRYIIQEWGKMYKMPFLSKNITATLLAVGSCVLLAFGAGGPSGKGGMLIWPLLGATNQLLAGLTLLVISLFLSKNKRTNSYTLFPMIFLYSMTISALLIQAGTFLKQSNYLLFTMSVIILGAAIWIATESTAVFIKMYRERKALQGAEGL